MTFFRQKFGLFLTLLLVLIILPFVVWSVVNLRLEVRKRAKENLTSKPRESNQEKKFKKGELIIKFKEEAGAILDEQLKRKSTGNLSLAASDLPKSFSIINSSQERYKIKAIEPILKKEKINQIYKGKSYLQQADNIKRKYPRRSNRAASHEIKLVNLLNVYKITLADESVDVLSAVNSLKRDRSVEYVEPNYIRHFSYTPNDEYYPIQYPLNNTGQGYPAPGGVTNHGSNNADISAPESWDTNKGEGIVVAVIDTGVDYNHPDLDGQVWINDGEIPNNSLDDDGNGYVDDVYGYDFHNDDSDPLDDSGHGTHCAGIIAAKQDNGLGISGIAPGSKIMSLKFLDNNGDGSDADAALAISYAVSNGADILSNSWGGGEDSSLLKEAVDNAFVQGVAVVGAAGNAGSKRPDYPAAYENSIAVAATDSNDAKADFSNYGVWVDIAAPGVDILSLRANGSDFYEDGSHIYNNNYYISSGTSMACPYVAGALALVISEFPDLDIHSIYGRLLSTTDNIDILNPNYQGLLGSGRLNALRALTDTPQPYFSVQEYLTDPSFLEGGKSFSLKINLKNSGELAENISCELKTGSPHISIENPIISLDRISPFSSAELGFNFTTLPSLPVGSEIIFNLKIQYNSGKSKEFWITIKRTVLPEPGWPVGPQVHFGDNAASVMADLNNDGKQEVIIGSELNKLYVFSNEGKLLPGWPFTIDNDSYSGWAVVTGDVNVDGLLEIIAVFDGGVSSNHIFKVYVLDKNGEVLSGWPFSIEAPGRSTPALGNLDEDRELEIVFGSFDGKVYILNHDGTTLPGWPIQVSSEWIDSSPALADIDNDDELEIIIGCRDNKIYALNIDGSSVAGWPFEAGDFITSSPSVADINNDGKLEIVFGSWDSYVYVLNNDGTLLSGWPVATGGLGYWVTSSPAIGDINLDGKLDIIIGSHDYKVYAFNYDATLLPGWPIETGWYINSSPALGNLDDDKELEIVISSADQNVYAFNHDGNSVPGWPVAIDEQKNISPLIGDIDNDGKAEVLWGRYAWESPSKIDFPGAIYWPKFKNDNYNSGLYRVPLCPTRARGDLNCDNFINEVDLVILLGHWKGADLPTIETLIENWKT